MSASLCLQLSRTTLRIISSIKIFLIAKDAHILCVFLIIYRNNMRFTFPKAEHLCLKNDVAALFESGSAFVSFPYRVVIRKVDKDSVPVKVLIISQKKKLREAVWRVLLRRQIREAYRLNKAPLFEFLGTQPYSLHVAFMSVESKTLPQKFMHDKMAVTISKIINKLKE